MLRWNTEQCLEMGTGWNGMGDLHQQDRAVRTQARVSVWSRPASGCRLCSQDARCAVPGCFCANSSERRSCCPGPTARGAPWPVLLLSRVTGCPSVEGRVWPRSAHFWSWWFWGRGLYARVDLRLAVCWLHSLTSAEWGGDCLLLRLLLGSETCSDGRAAVPA